MQLTLHTDYALRLLIYLCDTCDRRVSIAEVAEAQAISRTHLMKIANELAHHGFIEATRGRGGGIRLASAPSAINLGRVIAVTEGTCKLIDCAGCRLYARCKLPGILDQATDAFREVLARYSLADLLKEKRRAA